MGACNVTGAFDTALGALITGGKAGAGEAGALITDYCDFFAHPFIHKYSQELNGKEQPTKPIDHAKYVIIVRIDHNMAISALLPGRNQWIA